MHRSNPLARRDYPRRAAIQKDLDRYYGDCMASTTAKRFKSVARRESYCSGVSWKIARQAGRYPDYFRGVRENPVDDDLRTIRVLFRAPDALTLWGIPYDLRPGQAPIHLWKSEHSSARRGWIYLGEPGWYGSLSRERIDQIKAFLAEHKDLVPGNPYEWTVLPAARQNPITASREERRQVKLTMQAGHDHAKTQLRVFNVGDPRRAEMDHARALAYFEQRLPPDLAEIAALEYARTWERHHDLPRYRRSEPPGAAARNPIGTSAGIIAVGVGLASAIAYGFSKLTK